MQDSLIPGVSGDGWWRWLQASYRARGTLQQTKRRRRRKAAPPQCRLKGYLLHKNNVVTHTEKIVDQQMVMVHLQHCRDVREVDCDGHGPGCVGGVRHFLCFWQRSVSRLTSNSGRGVFLFGACMLLPQAMLICVTDCEFYS